MNELNISQIILGKDDNFDSYCPEDNENFIAKEFIEGTEQLINYKKSNNNLLIKDMNDLSQVIGRQFLKKNNNIGYEEIFLNKNYRLLSNLDEQFSILFPPGTKEIKKSIGIRYFRKNVRNIEDGYFTLIIKENKKFEILEKKQDIKDINGKPFYNENIDCFKIMQDILFSKFEKDKDYIGNFSTIEILGFIFSAKEVKIDKCIIMEPFIPNLFDRSTIKESIQNFNENYLYLEPILYQFHISFLLIFFSSKDKCRYNFLFDMSNFHGDILQKDNYVFPKEMKSNLKIIPKVPIQSGPTCGLWFIGQIFYIIKKGIMAFKNIKKEDKKYCAETIITISELLNIPKFISNDKVMIENDYIFNNFIISRNISYNPFLKVMNFFTHQNITYSSNTDILFKYEKKFSDARDLITNYKYNYKHYSIKTNKKLNVSNDDIKEIEKIYNEAKEIFNELFDVYYSYIYQNDSNKFCKYEQLQKDINNKFNYINSKYKEFSDDYYLYKIDDLQNIYNDNLNNSILFSCLYQ